MHTCPVCAAGRASAGLIYPLGELTQDPDPGLAAFRDTVLTRAGPAVGTPEHRGRQRLGPHVLGPARGEERPEAIVEYLDRTTPMRSTPALELEQVERLRALGYTVD